MKNLKRVLSLGLASVMLLGMMVMGASAATFSDSDEIQNTEAVNMMAALNVIKGKDTGAFDPKGLVTRAEMAKMITMILFGGEEPALAAGTASKFSDVPANHWARKYIEYCAGDQLKIIAGNGDGTFAPDANITGTQAAKMALVALGYNATVYGFEGTRDWEININYVANTKEANLYNGLKNLNPSEQITRDQAAQILYNALNAQVMVPQYTVTNNGKETTYIPATNSDGSIVTLLANKFSNVDDTKTGVLTGISYDKETELYTYTLDDNSTWPFASDVSDLFGRKVKVIINTADDDKVLGIAATKDSTVLATGVVGDLSADKDKDNNFTGKLKVGSKTYAVTGATDANKATVANAIAILGFNGTVTDGTVGTPGTGMKPWFEVEVIDNDGDKKVDQIVAHPVTLATVSGVTKTAVTAGSTYKFEENTIEDGLARLDKVLVTTTGLGSAANKCAIIEKAEVTTGKVRSLNFDKKQVQVGSTWYKATGTYANLAALEAEFERGTEYDLIIVNGYILDAEEAEETSAANAENTVYVLAKDNPSAGVETGTQRVKLLFADNTSKIVTVTNVNGKTGSNLGSGSGKDCVENPGELYTYTVLDDGTYKLVDLKDNAKDAVTDPGDYDSGKIDITSATDNLQDGKVTKSGTTYRFADDAVIFVEFTHNEKEDVKAVTGADVNNWSKATAGITLYANKSSGFMYAALALIDLGAADIPGASADTNYGWITKDSIDTSDDKGDKYIELTIWNGTEEIVAAYYNDEKKASEFPKGSIISYQNAANAGEIQTVEVETFTDDAVKAYAGGSEIEMWSNGNQVEKMVKDPIIIYVDMKEDTGADSGSIQLAEKALNADGSEKANTYVGNVMYKTNADHEITVLFVDVTNDSGEEISSAAAPAPTYTVSGAGDVSATGDNTGSAYTVEVSSASAAANATVTVTVKVKTAVTTGTDTLTLSAKDADNGAVTLSATNASVDNSKTAGETVLAATFTMPAKNVTVTLTATNAN